MKISCSGTCININPYSSLLQSRVFQENLSSIIYKYQSYKLCSENDSRLHAPSIHGTSSRATPSSEQSFPPNCGTGFSHSRVRNLVHFSWSQPVQSDQLVKSPWIAKTQETSIKGTSVHTLPPFLCQCSVLRVFKVKVTPIRKKTKQNLESPRIKPGNSSSEVRALTNWVTPAPKFT